MITEHPQPAALRCSSRIAVAGVSLLLLLVPLAWWPRDVYGLVKWTLVAAVASAMAAAYLACSLFANEFRFRRNGINLPLALILCWSALSLSIGPHTYYVLRRLKELTLFALLYFSLVNALDTRGRRLFAAAASLGGLAAISLLGIAHYAGLFRLDSPWGAGLGRRVYATMLNPNYLADYIASLFPIGLALFAMRRSSRTVDCLIASVILASFLCLLFTVTWGGWAAWLVSAAMAARLLFIRRDGAARRRTAGILAACLAMAGLFLFINRDTAASDYTGMKTRVLYWRACLRMIRERPIAGFGLNAFQPFIPKYLTEIIASDFKEGPPEGGSAVTVYEGNYAHNEYLGVWLESGIVGLALFIWFFTRFFLQVRRNIHAGGGPEEYAFQAAAACGVAAVLTESIFNYPLRVPASSVSVALLLAFAGSGSASRTARMRIGFIPAVVRWALALAVIASWMLLLPRMASPIIGECLYVRARNAWARRDWVPARGYCLSALDYPLTEPEVFDLLGESAETLGLEAEAMEAFRRKLDLKPYDVYANLKLGGLYARLGRNERARMHFAAALGMERHDSAAGRARLADLMLREGKVEAAIRVLEAGLPSHRADWSLRNALGIAYAAGGNSAASAAEFMAAEERGGDIPAYNLRMLRQGGGSSRFIGPLSADWVEKRLERGRYAMGAGYYREAGREFGAVLERFPGFPPAERGMQACLVSMRQPRRASNDIGRGLREGKAP